MELQFIHTSYADTAEDYLGLEIAAVFGGGDVGLHFETQGLDVRHGGVEGDEELEALEEAFAAGYVVDPERVEDVVRDLDYFEVSDAFETGVEE